MADVDDVARGGAAGWRDPLVGAVVHGRGQHRLECRVAPPQMNRGRTLMPGQQAVRPIMLGGTRKLRLPCGEGEGARLKLTGWQKSQPLRYHFKKVNHMVVLNALDRPGLRINTLGASVWQPKNRIKTVFTQLSRLQGNASTRGRLFSAVRSMRQIIASGGDETSHQPVSISQENSLKPSH